MPGANFWKRSPAIEKTPPRRAVPVRHSRQNPTTLGRQSGNPTLPLVNDRSENSQYPRSASSEKPRLLVVAYGNELRSDDGLGPQLGRAIEARQLPGVVVIATHQLMPELAEQISTAQEVLFIDARAVGSDPVQLTKLSPQDSQGPIRAHGSQPAVLLRLAQAIFGRSPPAWCLTLRGIDFGFGETTSSVGTQALHAGLEIFLDYWDSRPQTLPAS